jgi:hypothetical protein
MTDIDALVAEARDWQRRWDAGRVPAGTNLLIGGLLDALTAERARVVELEAFRNGYKDYIRKLQDSAEAERAKGAALEAEVERRDEIIACNAGLAGRLLRIEQERDTAERLASVVEAEAARWREVAGEMAGAMQKAEPHLDAIICYASTMDEHEPNRIAHDFRAALARFKQESGQ